MITQVTESEDSPKPFIVDSRVTLSYHQRRVVTTDLLPLLSDPYYSLVVTFRITLLVFQKKPSCVSESKRRPLESSSTPNPSLEVSLSS